MGVCFHHRGDLAGDGCPAPIRRADFDASALAAPDLDLTGGRVVATHIKDADAIEGSASLIAPAPAHARRADKQRPLNSVAHLRTALIEVPKLDPARNASASARADAGSRAIDIGLTDRLVIRRH